MNGLILSGLVVGRGSFRAGPFDLAAPPASLVALIGPNGGGKTSLLRVLAGLDPPRAGSLTRPPGTPAHLPPPGTLDAPFEAEHIVALGLIAGVGLRAALRADDRARARDALAALGIADLGPRPFDQLSSGQKQLVLLARVQLQDAALCLLDEPTATLDPAQAAKVLATIGALASGGRTAVVATHDLAAARAADLVLTVGPEPVSGPPGAVLTPAILAKLYGADASLSPTCGQSAHGTMRA